MKEIMQRSKGHQLILVACGLAFLSMFMPWADLGIISANGFQNDAYIFLLLWIYPIVCLSANKKLIRAICLPLSILSILLGFGVVDHLSADFFGEQVNVSGSGLYLYITSSFIFLVGSIFYKEVNPDNTMIEVSTSTISNRQNSKTDETETLTPCSQSQIAESFAVYCPQCGQKYRAETQMIGTFVPCQTCGTDFEIANPVTEPQEKRPDNSVQQQGVKSGFSKGSVTLSILLILLGVAEFVAALFYDFNFTSFLGGMARYTAWVSIVIGAYLLTTVTKSRASVPAAGHNEQSFFRYIGHNTRLNLTSLRVLIEIVDTDREKHLPGHLGKGMHSFSLSEITGCKLHNKGGFIQGVILSINDTQTVAIPIHGKHASVFFNHFHQVKSGKGVLKSLTINAAEATAKITAGVGTAWLAMTTVGIVITLASAGVDRKSYPQVADWQSVGIFGTESHRECLNDGVSHASPFKVFGKITSSLESPKTYQCDIVDLNYFDSFESLDFVGTFPQALNEGDYFEATAFFDENIAGKTLFDQKRTLPKLDIQNLAIHPESKMINVILASMGKDLTIPVSDQNVGVVNYNKKRSISIPKNLGLNQFEKETQYVENDNMTFLAQATGDLEDRGFFFANYSLVPETRSDTKRFLRSLAKGFTSSISEDVDADEEFEIDDFGLELIGNFDGARVKISNWEFQAAYLLLLIHEGGTFFIAAVGEENWAKKAIRSIEQANSESFFDTLNQYDLYPDSLNLNKSLSVAEASREGIYSQERVDSANDKRMKPKGPASLENPSIENSNLKDKLKLAELKGMLAKIDSRIESERKRYKQAQDVINKLTNFRRTPVKEGSAAYFKCLEASKIIQAIESEAPSIKAEKAGLEVQIKVLEE